MDPTQREFERAQTLSLLFKFSSIAVVVPAAALALVAAYCYGTGAELERSDWKTIVFFVWAGTMIALGWSCWSVLGDWRVGRSSRREREQKERVADDTTLNKWERRKTASLSGELFKTAIVVPSIALLLVCTYQVASGQPLGALRWSSVVFWLWLGTMLCLLFDGIRASRAKMVYSDKNAWVISN